MPCVSHAHRYTAGLVDSDTGKLTPAGPLTLPPATDGCTWSLGEPGQWRACFTDFHKDLHTFLQHTLSQKPRAPNDTKHTWVRSVLQMTYLPNTRACSGMHASVQIPMAVRVLCHWCCADHKFCSMHPHRHHRPDVVGVCYEFFVVHARPRNVRLNSQAHHPRRYCRHISTKYCRQRKVSDILTC